MTEPIKTADWAAELCREEATHRLAWMPRKRFEEIIQEAIDAVTAAKDARIAELEASEKQLRRLCSEALERMVAYRREQSKVIKLAGWSDTLNKLREAADAAKEKGDGS